MCEKDDEVAAAQGSPVNDGAETPEPRNDVSDDLEALRSDRDKYLDLARRTQAEFENYQKRVRRDWDADLKFAAQPILADLLPVLDNLERALDSAKGTEATGPLHQGIELVHKQWLDVLAKHGARPMAPVGAPFDPNQHEAVMQQPSAEHPPMTVLAVTRTGYTLHDRVLRPAQVIVSQAE